MQFDKKTRSLRAMTCWVFIIYGMVALLGCGQPDAMTSQGEPFYLKKQQGKWLVINYWASWCTSCYEELPELNRLAKNHGKKLTLVGVNFDGASAKEQNKFAAEQQIGYPLLMQDIGQQFGVSEIATLPATVIISPQGQQVALLLGSQTEASILQQLKE